MFGGSFYILLAILPALSLAQEPDCSALGYQSSFRPGDDLPQCATRDQQCCSRGDINEFEMSALEALRDGLAEEFGLAVDQYDRELGHVTMFFKQAFSERLIERFPGGKLINKTSPGIVEVTRSLADNLIIPDRYERERHDDQKEKRQKPSEFNPEDFAERLIEATVDGDAEAIGRENSERQNCVERILSSAVNEKRNEFVPVISNGTQIIRQALTTLTRIGNFLKQRRRALSNATFQEHCAPTLINISFCSRCRERTAPLCFNGCNALLRACYAPYLKVLNRRYSELWTLVRKVINTANTTVAKLYHSFETILDNRAEPRNVEQGLDERIKKDCGFDLPTHLGDHRQGQQPGDQNQEQQPKKREEDGNNGDDDRREYEEALLEESNGIPGGLIREVLLLRDVIRYRSDGLRLCFKSLHQSDNCHQSATGEPQERYCEGTNVCTAKCQCTIGNGTQEEDIEEFLYDDIESQVNNTILPLSVQDLNFEVASLEGNDPVASFLKSDEINSVLPPDPEENEGGEEEEDKETSGAGHHYSTIPLVLLPALLFGLS